MKLSLLISLKSFLIILASLSHLFMANSALAFGRGLSYIEDPSESPKTIAKELEKQKNILSKLSSPEERENHLRRMCEIELMSKVFDLSITFCKKYFDLAVSNQSLYSQEAKVKSAKQMCLVLPFQVYRYQHLNNDSLKKVLGACKQTLLETFSQLNSSGYVKDEPVILQNLKSIYLILEDYSGGKAFFQDIINRANRIQDKDVSINIIYPTLNFIGDIYFEADDFNKAMSIYLEADSIYTKYINCCATYNLTDEFLTDEAMAGGYVSVNSIIRAYSFVGNRSRLAFIMAMKGKTNEAKKLLDKSIFDLEKASNEQRDNKDAIALQEIGTPLYTIQQSLLISETRYEEALEYADRSRSTSYLISLKGTSKNIPDILSFSKMQAFAKKHKATLVLYSIPDFPLYNYKKFQAKEDKVFIWVIQPNGKLDFREVDVLSTLNKANYQSESSNLNSNETQLTYKAIILLIILVILLVVFPDKRRIVIAAFVGIGGGLLLTNISNNILNDIFVKFDSRGNRNTEETEVLSNLTEDTLLTINNRGLEQSCKSSDCLKSLYKVLIDPIQNTLPNKPDEHIIFIPYRGLHRVPFASLISPNDQYLIDRHTIRIAPSIQALKFFTERASTTKRAGNNYLIVGNPVMPKLSLGSLGEPKPLTPLLSAETEAKEIAKLYGAAPLIGKDASLERVNSNLFNSQILHFATHSFLNIKDIGAGLVFTSESSKENSGVLATREFYGSRFLAEMVVLSACDTGLGVETVEGNLGLTRPFLIGGVPTVVSSLWQVPDNSTTELMIDFHKNLKETSDKAKALRQAMLSTKQKYPDPVYWAGFILTGLAKPSQISTSTSVKQVVGYMVCGERTIQSSLGVNSRDLVSATLESAPNGFILTLTEANNQKHKVDLDQNLVVVSASSFYKELNRWGAWNLSAYTKTPWDIKSDGSFKQSMSVSSRSSCSFEGQLEFIGDAAKLQNR